MYWKTSFVFLVTLAIVQGIVIGKSTDRTLVGRPGTRLTHEEMQSIIRIQDRAAARDRLRMMSSVLKSIMPIVRNRVVQYVLTAALHLLAHAIFYNIFQCFSSQEHIAGCKEEVASFTRKYMTPEKIRMTSEFVQEALTHYGNHLKSESMDIDERKNDKQIAAESDHKEEKSAQKEEDNETKSYM